MASVVDDHLLRDILTGERILDLEGIAPAGVATTGLWLFLRCSSLAEPGSAGKQSAPVAGFPSHVQARFPSQLTALRDEIEVRSMRELAWSVAELQHRHRRHGRGMSAAIVEALAAAERLSEGIAVSKLDVEPNLKASAEADGVAFRSLQARQPAAPIDGPSAHRLLVHHWLGLNSRSTRALR